MPKRSRFVAIQRPEGEHPSVPPRPLNPVKKTEDALRKEGAVVPRPSQASNGRTNPLRKLALILPLCWASAAGGAAAECKIDDGTVFRYPQLIQSSDPSSFTGVSYTGQATREMFDRRLGNDGEWKDYQAYVFQATYDDGVKFEIAVNPEFGSREAAEKQAQKYGKIIGRLPTALRKGVEIVPIHKGTKLFGGGNKDILIHIGQADEYAKQGVLEEALAHEASHTSLDAAHARAAGWVKAQKADGKFISYYACDNPEREDIAESFVSYLAVAYRSNRISAATGQSINGTIPNRIAYFNNQPLDMYPITPDPAVRPLPSDPAGGNRVTQFKLTNRSGREVVVQWNDPSGRTSLAHGNPVAKGGSWEITSGGDSWSLHRFSIWTGGKISGQKYTGGYLVCSFSPQQGADKKLRSTAPASECNLR